VLSLRRGHVRRPDHRNRVLGHRAGETATASEGPAAERGIGPWNV
jgi:hypothetical protein